MMRLQLGVPDNELLSPEKYNQIMTLHGTTMIFLVIVPVWAGFANYLLPLMIGARDVAFPRLNAWSYWMFLFGGIALYASLFFTPPEAGWFSYVPLSSRVYSESNGQEAWIYMVHLTGLSLDPRLDQLHRDDPQHARPRHGLGPSAAVRVGDARLRLPGHHRAVLPGRDGDDAAAGPQLRHALLRSDRRRLGAAVAAPVLVLRAPGGLHPRAAGLRRLLRGPAGLRPQADLRLQGDRRLHRGHRLPRPARVGAPHVRRADVHRRAGLLHAVLAS